MFFIRFLGISKRVKKFCGACIDFDHHNAKITKNAVMCIQMTHIFLFKKYLNLDQVYIKFLAIFVFFKNMNKIHYEERKEK